MKYKKCDESKWMLRLDKGDKIPESIINFCRMKKIQSAQIGGIGALSKSVIGFFSLEKQKYFEHKYPEHHELISFKGNVTLKNKKPFLHAHAILSGPDNKAVGGHLVSAEVSATAELFVDVVEKTERILDKKSGLYLWKLK